MYSTSGHLRKDYRVDPRRTGGTLKLELRITYLWVRQSTVQSSIESAASIASSLSHKRGATFPVLDCLTSHRGITSSPAYSLLHCPPPSVASNRGDFARIYRQKSTKVSADSRGKVWLRTRDAPARDFVSNFATLLSNRTRRTLATMKKLYTDIAGKIVLSCTLRPEIVFRSFCVSRLLATFALQSEKKMQRRGGHRTWEKLIRRALWVVYLVF